MIRIHKCEVGGVTQLVEDSPKVATSVGLWLCKQHSGNPGSILSTMERGRQTERERVEVN